MNLSERQQQTVATALTLLAALVILAAILGLFLILASFVSTFSHVLLPLAVAGIVALVFQPYYEWLRERCRLSVPLAVIALLASIVVPIGIVVALFGVLVIREIVDFIQDIPTLWERAWQYLETNLPDIKKFLQENPVGQRLSEAVGGFGPALTSRLDDVASTSLAATSSLASWTAAMLSWAVTPVYFVFFLVMERKDVGGLEHYLPFLKEEKRKDVVFLAREFVNIMVAFFRGQILIALLQGVLLSIGFTLVGLKYGFLLGFVLGFLNVIPYLGSMVGLVITLPLSFFQEGGGPGTLFGVLAVLAIVQLVEGYVLTPRIMGSRTGLHPMVIIVAVLFWGSALGGILGMILAIPLTAFLVVFWRLARSKYISEWV